MENIVGKEEIACNKQFLLFPQCFLPYMVLIFHFKCTLKCRLQFVSIWTSLKLCHGLTLYNTIQTFKDHEEGNMVRKGENAGNVISVSILNMS